jgi:hypothetical protein
LPDGFAKKFGTKKVTPEDLLELSRQQGAALAETRARTEAVQQEIGRRTT